MKKILLSAVALIAFGFAAKAQQDGIKYGVKAGVNLANFDTDGSKGITGFYVGGLADIPVMGNFHFQPEVSYSGEGAKDAALNYIRVPLMAKYYVVENVSILVGPEFGFKVGGDSTIDDNTKSFDFGIGAGAAYELAMGVFFEARYNLGLTKINDYQSQIEPQIPVGGSLPDFKNTNFQLGVGYRF